MCTTQFVPVYLHLCTFFTYVHEWFLKDHDTEDWSNDAENPALITEINYT